MDKKRFPNKKAVEEQKANLIDADLTKMNLKDANLYGASMNYANLKDANLKGVDFRGNLDDL